MPQQKQPPTLLNIALPVTALVIRYQCDAILRNYNDVTQSAFQDRIESFNEQLRKEVPQDILERIRQLQNLAVFIYFKVKTLKVQKQTLRDTPIHQHLTLNVCPKLDHVTLLDLSVVEGTLDLFRAITANCHELRSIFINTNLSRVREEVATWLPLLTECKKLVVIRNKCCKFDLYDESESFRLHNDVSVQMWQELPELREFLCDIASILAKKDLLSDVYNITHFSGAPESDLSAENIQWLNIHCPDINNIMLVSINDTILEALASTDWKIRYLKLDDLELNFSEAMKLFFKNKGMFIEHLEIYFVPVYHGVAISYDNLLWISQWCPALTHLSFEGDWYNSNGSTPIHTTSTCLFPNLEHFSMSVRQCTADIPVILESLINLRELECHVIGDAILPFLNTIAGLKNTFAHLTKVMMVVFFGTTDTTSKFKQRFVPIAMGWKNIREIYLCFSDLILLPVEHVQSVEEIKSTIKEQNLDVQLTVLTSTMFPQGILDPE